jgi:TfoX/Sxy family transcriptional regulator of competence genes
MAWTKIPPEHHPLFLAALPADPRVETLKMFGGIAARVNGHIFAGLFGRSTMIWLPPAERSEALELEGAAYFDPMGDGRRSDKVMLPESVMQDADDLRHWIARAFEAASSLPPKAKSKQRPSAVAKKASAKRSGLKR